MKWKSDIVNTFQPDITIEGMIRNPGRFVFVVHFYMPGEVGIDMPVTIYSDGQVFTGEINIIRNIQFLQINFVRNIQLQQKASHKAKVRIHHFKSFMVPIMTWLNIMEGLCYRRPMLCSVRCQIQCIVWSSIYGIWLQ